MLHTWMISWRNVSFSSHPLLFLLHFPYTFLLHFVVIWFTTMEQTILYFLPFSLVVSVLLYTLKKSKKRRARASKGECLKSFIEVASFFVFSSSIFLIFILHTYISYTTCTSSFRTAVGVSKKHNHWIFGVLSYYYIWKKNRYFIEKRQVRIHYAHYHTIPLI